MSNYYGAPNDFRQYLRGDSLAHFGILGMKWGVRRYQNPDGSLTPAGRKRYGTSENFENVQKLKKASKKGTFLGGPVAGIINGARTAKKENIKLLSKDEIKRINDEYDKNDKSKPSSPEERDKQATDKLLSSGYERKTSTFAGKEYGWYQKNINKGNDRIETMEFDDDTAEDRAVGKENALVLEKDYNKFKELAAKSIASDDFEVNYMIEHDTSGLIPKNATKQEARKIIENTFKETFSVGIPNSGFNRMATISFDGEAFGYGDHSIDVDIDLNNRKAYGPSING